MRSLLKGEALQLFIKKGEKLENQTNAHHVICISVVSGTFFPKNTLQMQALLAKGPSTQSNDHQQVHCELVAAK